MTNTNDFLKKDIKDMIKNANQNIGYIRGYIAACYYTKNISTGTLSELKDYLAEKLDNIIEKNKEGGESKE